MPVENPRRRRYRPSAAAWVLFAVIITLGVIVARGPAKFFEARDVVSGVSCTVRHCPAPDGEPDGRLWRGDNTR